MSERLEQLCTVKEACYSERAGRTTIYARIRAGHYKAVKIGGSTRLLVSSLKAFRKTLEANAPAAITTAATVAAVTAKTFDGTSVSAHTKAVGPTDV